MEPIKKEIIERKALMQRWAREIDRLVAFKVGLSERAALEVEYQIGYLRYKIGCGESALKDLEDLAAEGRSPKRERPPLPKARRLGVVERQRIEQTERAKLLATLKPPTDMEIHVHVGRVTDEHGQPSIHIQVSPQRRSEDDAV